MQAKRWGIGLIIACCSALTGAAHAQPDDDAPSDDKAVEDKADATGEDSLDDKTGEDDRTADDSAADDAAKDDSAADDAKADEPAESDGGGDSDLDPTEKEHERYFFLGLRFRNYVVPAFMLDAFLDGGVTVNSASFGPEFTTRIDGLELNVAVSYHDFSMEPALMKSKDDDDNAYEIISSDLKGISLTIDILFELWKSERSEFALLLGGGVGLTGIFDELRRNQVRPASGNTVDPDNPNSAVKCSGQNDPADPGGGTAGAWCDDSNEHYDNYTEPSWANGGSKPFIWPYINLPQISFRYKPIKQLQARADIGFAVTNGFFFGLNAAYGF